MENDKTNELLRELIELQKIQIDLKNFSNKKEVSIVRASDNQVITFVFVPGWENDEGNIAQFKTLIIPQNSYIYQATKEMRAPLTALYPTQCLIPSVDPFTWTDPAPAGAIADQNTNRIYSVRSFARHMVRNSFMVKKMILSFPRWNDQYWIDGDPSTADSNMIQPFTYSAVRAVVGNQDVHSGFFKRNDLTATGLFPNGIQDWAHDFVAEDCNFIMDGSTTLAINEQYGQQWVSNGGQQKYFFILQLHIKNIFNS